MIGFDSDSDSDSILLLLLLGLSSLCSVGFVSFDGWTSKFLGTSLALQCTNSLLIEKINSSSEDDEEEHDDEDDEDEEWSSSDEEDDIESSSLLPEYISDVAVAVPVDIEGLELRSITAVVLVVLSLGVVSVFNVIRFSAKGVKLDDEDEE